MTGEELRAFLSARLRWIVGVALVGVLVLGGKCYGDAQYARGRDLARADVADSIGKVYEAHYRAVSDSLARSLADFKAQVVQANARADAAEARALAVQADARRILTPQIIAQTPPEVLALVARQGVAIDTLMASNRALRVAVDTALAREMRFKTTLELADSAIAQKDRTIIDLRSVKDPPHGFWHKVGEVAGDVGLVAAGGGLVKLIFH